MSEKEKDGGRSAIKRFQEETTSRIDDKETLGKIGKEFPEVEEFAEDLEPRELMNALPSPNSDTAIDQTDTELTENVDPETTVHGKKHDNVIDVESKEKSLRESLRMKSDDTGSGQTK
jgi:hypothetical protein